MDIIKAIKTIFGSGWSFVRGFIPGVHNGYDIAAAIGKPVPALHSGQVVFASFAGGGGTGYVHTYRAPDQPAAANSVWATGGGNVVVVQDAAGVLYQYAHLSQFDVKVGDIVSAGTVVGQVGDTGDATGPHLHFAMIDTSGGTKRWIDPTSFLTSLGLAGGIPVGDTGTGSGGGPDLNPLDAVGNSITTAATFVGLILVGIVLLLLAGFVSGNAQKAMGAS